MCQGEVAVGTFGQCWRFKHPIGGSMSLPWRGGRSMFPQAEVCDLLEGVGTLWGDEALYIAFEFFKADSEKLPG